MFTNIKRNNIKKHTHKKKWNPSLKRKIFLKGSNLKKYNQFLKSNPGIDTSKIIINTQNFYLKATEPYKLQYAFKENLNKHISLEFFKFQHFFGNLTYHQKKKYPLLVKKLQNTLIYAIRLRGYDLFAYCLINNKVKIIKLTTLMGSLGLPYYKTLLGYLSAPDMVDKGKFFDLKISNIMKRTHKAYKPNFINFTRWPIVHFIVGAAMFYTNKLLWQKVLLTKFKKNIFKPRTSLYHYYNYRRLWNIRLKKWSLRPSKANFTLPIFQALFAGRVFYQKLFNKSTLLVNSPSRGRFVFKYEDKKFMKRFFVQSLVKQGKRLRAINWFKDVMTVVKKRLSLSRITNFKAFYFTLMRLKPRYWLRKFKRGRRTDYYPTWIKDKRNKAEAVRLFLKVSKSTAPGAKTVSKQRMIDLIILNTFYKKNDAYDALIAYWQTVRKNMHNMNFVPWV